MERERAVVQAMLLAEGVAALGEHLRYSSRHADPLFQRPPDYLGVTVAQLGVTLLTLFFILNFVTSVSNFRREDMKFLVVLSALTAIVATCQ